MPVKKYSFEVGGAQHIEISWKGSWKNGVVLFDGNRVGSFSGSQELKSGREFPLQDGSMLKVHLVSRYLIPELHVFRNGEPLPGSGAHPEQLLASAYGAVFFVAAMWILLGFFAELNVKLLKDMGFGVHTVFTGIIFLVLGFYVKGASMIALGIAIGIYVIEGIFYFVDAARHAGPPPVGGILIRLFILTMMFRGFGAIQALKTPARFRPVSSTRTITVGGNTVSVPVPGPASSISFVAPAVPPAPTDRQTVDPIEAERLRLELSRASHTQADRGPASRVLNRPFRQDIRTRPAPADAAASALRFVAYRCEIGEESIRAVFTNNTTRDLPWMGIVAIVIRQLPSGPPWEGKILLDLVPSTTPGATLTPLRLFSTTYVNYAYLPQGHSPSSQENLRRLANFAVSKNPAIQVEPGTALFLQGGKGAPRFFSMAQFAEYDSRYS